jgi:hypothetical protein
MATRFENIHRSKLCAFIDGACTALCIAWIATIIRNRKAA